MLEGSGIVILKSQRIKTGLTAESYSETETKILYSIYNIFNIFCDRNSKMGIFREEKGRMT